MTVADRKTLCNETAYIEASILDFLFPIAVALSAYLLFDIPMKKVKARKPIPMYLFVACLSSLLFGMNSILVVMYPKLEDPHFGSLAQFLNIVHHLLDLGMSNIPNYSFHVGLSYCCYISTRGICRVAFLQITCLVFFDCFGFLYVVIPVWSVSYL
jgi:hypothetical protein